jgi:hypothetical protein
MIRTRETFLYIVEICAFINLTSLEAVIYNTNVRCGSGSVVEHRLAKARVAGSNPVFRSIYDIKKNLGNLPGFVYGFYQNWI